MRPQEIDENCSYPSAWPRLPETGTRSVMEVEVEAQVATLRCADTLRAQEGGEKEINDKDKSKDTTTAQR